MSHFVRIRRVLTISFALLIAHALARSGHAYCVRQGDFIAAWSHSFPDLTIPVYVTSSGPSSTANTGHSPEDVARIVTEVLARHNESVVVPKLTFAGFTTSVARVG